MSASFSIVVEPSYPGLQTKNGGRVLILRKSHNVDHVLSTLPLKISTLTLGKFYLRLTPIFYFTIDRTSTAFFARPTHLKHNPPWIPVIFFPCLLLFSAFVFLSRQLNSIDHKQIDYPFFNTSPPLLFILSAFHFLIYMTAHIGAFSWRTMTLKYNSNRDADHFYACNT